MADESASASPASNDPHEQVAHLRRELVKTQLVVLELNDRVLQKETDKADAVALLGQAELVLEQKINHVMELDRVLNLRIQELKSALAERAAEPTAETADLRAQFDARSAEVDTLVAKLDATNQELGRTHELAGRLQAELATAQSENEARPKSWPLRATAWLRRLVGPKS